MKQATVCRRTKLFTTMNKVTTHRAPVNLTLIILVVSLGGFLFGFDMAVISGVLPLVEKQFSLSAAQQGWFVSSALVGCIIAVIFSGELADRLGRKKPLLLAAALFLISAIGCALMPSLTGVICFRLIGGMGIGIASSVVPLYISEIAPAEKRGRLVTCYQFALTLGILVAYLSNVAWVSFAKTNALSSDVLWRRMFGVGAVPALFFLLGLLVVPESPRWLLNKGGRQEGSYREVFAPSMRKALLIGILLPLFSQFSGINAIIYYGPSILSNAGISLSNSLFSQVIFGVANMLFTLLAVWKVDAWGRRPLYLFGTAGATISLVLTGLCFWYGNTHGILLLICVLSFLACFAFSIGPLKFVVASEIFPNAIRGRALSISIMVMWIADTIVGQLTPVLLKEVGSSGTFWFFAFFCTVAFIFIYRFLPETKGRSLEQIEHDWKGQPIDNSKQSLTETHIPLH
jgi:SP family arabinose:H+ symporter-like MFS transporter